MEPGEALSTAAQIAVALAGFAGVVVVFRRESVHEWSTLDKFRLRLLLANSILPLGLCMIALLFLTIEPGTDGRLEVVQLCRIRRFCAIRFHDNDGFSALRSTPVAGRACQLHLLSVRDSRDCSHTAAVV
jgi:hypothetical protein